ncbi:helix-turn-helix domain-containing protein [Muricoccus nepalensis]|uniref:helix-turn-helix domain-containing protein n=1 Tax=Muricoccus nepalensis TaxID=1854500 RepID=UPI0019D55A3D|nr:helix-turn-helix transcriptional regulator [Roseomonas nepalensis]
MGDIARFLRREAVDVDHGRREEGLTWDDIALAASRVGVAREDGSPYPGASFSKLWLRLIERKQIVLAAAAAGDLAPQLPQPQEAATSIPIGEVVEPAVQVSAPARRSRRSNSSEKVIFGMNVRKAREGRGLTQIELARLTGIAQSDLSAVERGVANSTIDTMARIAAAVREPLHRLLTE